ncbi:MAG TPA: XRE family transcriptional regulator [Pseudolabrys sp.]|nr:XRE family transcriptional regulator [Pseudolabrys sp.]
MPDDRTVARGSGDFLRDMGYANPDKMHEKFALANTIALEIEDRGLAVEAAAATCGVSEKELARITCGIVDKHSVGALRRMAEMLKRRSR